jgi:predicted nucleic acid-binding protein
MSGNYLLDTNAIIYAINRKLRLPIGIYSVSVITKMELLSWPKLSQEDDMGLRNLLASMKVIELLPTIQETAIKVRKATALKLPDSIISATAMYDGSLLITEDEKLRNRHVGLSISLDELLAR